MSSSKTNPVGPAVVRKVEDNDPQDIKMSTEDRNASYLHLSGDAPHSSSLSETSLSPEVRNRRRVLALLCIIAALAVVAGVGYYFYAANYVSTDDAFIDGHIIPVSSRVSGHVLKVFVTDNQMVHRGDLLVELDPSDFEAKVAAEQALLKAAQASEKSHSISTDVTEITSSAGVKEASAAVEEAKAGVQTARAAVATAKSMYSQSQAQLAVSQAKLKQTQADALAAEARYDQSHAHLLRIKSLVAQHAFSQ
ncbi:MAG: HlyD family secretion protein [Thermoguttaceae bacterium]